DYVYNATGVDPAGSPLAWTLDAAPAGMSIDSRRGRVRWTPTASELASQQVEIRLTNGEGLSVTQRFKVHVRAINVPPIITSAPPRASGLVYRYPVVATEPDGSAVTFSLPTAPAGMSIDPASGLIQWTPTAAQLGTNPVTVTATDPQGAHASQNFVIVVGV